MQNIHYIDPPSTPEPQRETAPIVTSYDVFKELCKKTSYQFLKLNASSQKNRRTLPSAISDVSAGLILLTKIQYVQITLNTIFTRHTDTVGPCAKSWHELRRVLILWQMIKTVVCAFAGNRSSGFPGLQVRPLRPGERSHPLSVSPRSREPRLHEGVSERAQPAVDGTQTQNPGWSDYLQARLLSEQTNKKKAPKC